MATRPKKEQKVLEVETYVSDGLSVVFGLEDVGGYGRALAKYLVDHEQVVKEVNPALSFLERKRQVMIQKMIVGMRNVWHAYW